MSGLFITGAGTEIGKTFVTCALAHQLGEADRDVQVLKPVITGYDPANPADSDSGRLLAAVGLTPTDEMVGEISPWRYAAPIAPNMAARLEQRPIDLGAVATFCRDALAEAVGVTLIEGVGGVMAPITDDHTVLDWIAALPCPALLVSGSYLGAISHVLTAAAVLESRGIVLAGVVISESPDNPVPLAETVACVARLLPRARIVAVPRLRSYRDAPDLLGFLDQHQP